MAITQLLAQSAKGDQQAFNQLMPLIYGDLKKLAKRAFSSEKSGHTLQPTALVNEAFEKLLSVDIEWQNKAHFFGIAAKLMRQLLVDHARMKSAGKRGSNPIYTEISDDIASNSTINIDILALDSQLLKLADLDERKAKLLELQYFGGLNQKELAAQLGISETTVKNDLRFAKTWLNKSLSEQSRL